MDLASSSVRVAVSKPDIAATISLDPSNWKIFNFRIGNCPDQPLISISSDKVAISVETFVKKNDNSCVRQFLGSQTLLINKNDLITFQGGAGQQQPAFKITPAAVSAANPTRYTKRDSRQDFWYRRKNHTGKHSKRRKRI